MQPATVCYSEKKFSILAISLALHVAKNLQRGNFGGLEVDLQAAGDWGLEATLPTARGMRICSGRNLLRSKILLFFFKNYLMFFLF